MTKRVKKRNDFLGMSYSKAYSQLKRAILFELVQQAGRDICVKCRHKILSPGELTIEHIEPWEDRDPKLFFDLENVGFSHARCNRPHSVERKRLRKVAVNGKLICNKCLEPKEPTAFSADSRYFLGRQGICKSCHAQYKKLRGEERKVAPAAGLSCQTS